jgi:outer membrane protein
MSWFVRPLRSVPRRPGLTAAGSLLLGLLVAPAAVFAQAAPPASSRALSLEEAISTARAHNPNFLARQGDINVARWQVRSSTADFLPSVNASTSLGYTQPGEQRIGAVAFSDRPSYYSSDYNLSVSLELNGSKLLQPTVARANARATEQRVGGEEAALVSNVMQQYLSILQAQENVAQAEREVARTQEHVRLAQARLEVGAGTQLDVRRAEVQQGQAEIRLVQASNTQATTTLQLGQLMGTTLQPGVQLTSEFAVFDPTWQAADLVQRSLRNNPNLLAARASSDAARTGVRQAQSSFLPRLTLSTGVRGSVFSAGDVTPLVNQQLGQARNQFEACQQQNRVLDAVGMPQNACANPSTAEFQQQLRQQIEANNPNWPFDYKRQPISASMTFSLPLFTGLQRQVQVAQAQTSARTAEFAVRAQELQLRTDVETGLRNLQTAYRSAEIQERVRATAAEELRLAQERFRFGAASSVEVTDAQTNLAEAERAQIDAVYSFHQSLAVLEALIGESLRVSR